VFGAWSLAMKIDILLSGFGGQGLMSLGKVIATAAILENKFATYMPSYGPEVRGGTAYCYVKISDVPIASPLVETPDAAIILNQQSLNKFKNQLDKNCILILNSDLMQNKPNLSAKKIIYLPLSKAALECGDIKCANVVALGALIRLKPDILKQGTIIGILKKIFSANNSMLNINIKALSKGHEAAKNP
jgi:2-oxoglutarate ferredoxin oxidoreductase subunit gamma